VARRSERPLGYKPVGFVNFLTNVIGSEAGYGWTIAGSGPRRVALLHHTDAKREWAYGRHSKVGRLDKALDLAEANDWTIVDMATDRNSVFPRTGS
jgi:hypothetical protein